MRRTRNQASVALFSAFLSCAGLAGGCGGPSAGVPGSGGGVDPASGGGGGGGGGGLATWNVTPTSINFDTLPGNDQGSTSIGARRAAYVSMYNTSGGGKTVTPASITILGLNAGDFALDTASMSTTINNPIVADPTSPGGIVVHFVPTAVGLRSASLQIVSNAGTSTVQLMGSGSPKRPIASFPGGAINFTPVTPPYLFSMSNTGGDTLAVDGIAITGADAAAFQLVSTNRARTNCHGSARLPSGSGCAVGVALVRGAVGPKKADLVMTTNDPKNPTIDIPLSLSGN